MTTISSRKILKVIYQKLSSALGPQHWWPARTRFEVIVGAILTQNTNWENVTRALQNLRRHHLLNPQAMKDISLEHLAALIRSAGYFNVKARRLKNFTTFLFLEYGGSLKRMERTNEGPLRAKLLNINGIGPETADSILLYAFDKPVFVVDAYTKRIFSRHNIVGRDSDYHSIQKIFVDSLKPDRQLFNEYHALIVNTAKNHCKTKPLCERCPLNELNFEPRYAAYRYTQTQLDWVK